MSLYLEYEPVPIKVYIDYRDSSADNYPQIEVCGECAEVSNASLGEQGDIQPGVAAWCELCGNGNAAAMRLLEKHEA